MVVIIVAVTTIAGTMPLISSLATFTSASRAKMISATLVGSNIASVPEIATMPAAILGS